MILCVCVLGGGLRGVGWGWGSKGDLWGDAEGGAESTLLDLTVAVELQAWRYKLRAVSTGLSVK